MHMTELSAGFVVLLGIPPVSLVVLWTINNLITKLSIWYMFPIE